MNSKRKRINVILLATVLLIGLLVVLFNRPERKQSEEAPTTMRERHMVAPLRSELVTPSANSIAADRERTAIDEANKPKFEAARASDQSDREYRLKFEKHRAIKTYLGAPCRNYPAYQGLMTKLLENGYGVEEWPEAVRGISSWSEIEHHNANQMRLLGIPEEAIPREVERYRNENIGEWKRSRSMLKSRTGIDDEPLLDELMNLPLHWSLYNDPLNTAGIGFHSGETLLDDSDWMESQHSNAAVRFTGEQSLKKTITEITAAYGDAPLMVNENEAIIDKEDLPSALAPFRDNAYYEIKRNMHEMGKQRVQDAKKAQELRNQ